MASERAALWLGLVSPAWLNCGEGRQIQHAARRRVGLTEANYNRTGARELLKG
jgi:hypothetical protein